MIEIRKSIVAELMAVHPRVYFVTAPTDAEFPYLIYSVEATDLGDGLQMITLDVDVWDQKADTTDIENLMDQVKSRMDRALFINDELYLKFYLDRQLAIEMAEIGLNRRTNIFTARHYERS
jgi:hypothetical protein